MKAPHKPAPSARATRDATPHGGNDPLLNAVRRKRERHSRWLREGDLSVGRRLAQIGVLGWIIITPTLAGLYLGRWLDGRLATDIFWSAPLMMAGVAIGGWSAWKWMNAR